jgi:hypothetical protein
MHKVEHEYMHFLSCWVYIADLWGAWLLEGPTPRRTGMEVSTEIRMEMRRLLMTPRAGADVAHP